MVLSKSLKVEWRHSRSEWFEKGSKEKKDKVIASEKLAKDVILPSLGFRNILRFGEVNVRHGFKTRLFSFDIFAEKDDEKWLIEVTMNAQKRLDGGFIRIFKLLQPNLKVGVIHLKKDLSKYLFREVEDSLLSEGKMNIVTRITKNDFVFDRVRDVNECRQYLKSSKKPSPKDLPLLSK